ncbi:MAG: VWA domain-containing protein [Planctomycetes bacterium]|nr:VWA domain-containing protein [Planctomycetota bacterium]
MFLRNRWGRKDVRRRGAVMVQTVLFGGTVGLGVAALAIDTGLMYSARQELQSATDAAALAAASQLGKTEDAQALATAEAKKFAKFNEVMNEDADLVDADVVFGHAELVGSKYTFTPGASPSDAVKVTLKRDQTVGDGPVSLLFAKTFGMSGARMKASAVAMLVPRDIAMVVDLSGSMNDDSELRHHKAFASEKTGTINGVQINLKDIWLALPTSKGKPGVKNGSNPSSPSSTCAAGDLQPSNGASTPQSSGGHPDPGEEPSGGSLNPKGPRFGWMTDFGSAIVLGSYSAASDAGLYYIPKGSTTSNADVVANLTEAGYSSAERTVLLSGSNDSDTNYFKRRVKCLLGLAGWKSGKSGGKYTGTGDGDNLLESNELTQTVAYPFAQGSWDGYIDYVRSSSTQMEATDSQCMHRYGIKTFVNYLLESRESHAETPELANTPEEPLYSVKVAVQAMIDELIALETQDHVSLETFAQYGNHRLNLSSPGSGESLEDLLQEIPDELFHYQAGHDTPYTNIGDGLDEGIQELMSNRARAAATKVIILLTDGKPNVNEYGSVTGNNSAGALDWVDDRSTFAKSKGFTIYTVGVGGDVDDELLSNAATSPQHYYYADNQPDPDNDNKPKYINQLKQIFKELGGKRPVRLIQ